MSDYNVHGSTTGRYVGELSKMKGVDLKFLVDRCSNPSSIYYKFVPYKDLIDRKKTYEFFNLADLLIQIVSDGIKNKLRDLT